MKLYKSTTIIILTSLVLSSCSATQPLQLLPALLEQPSVESRLVIEKAIGSLLNSQPIKLADNVFTLKSTVIIERHQPTDGRGGLLNGRELRQADTFSLLIDDGECFVRHDQTGNIKILSQISCIQK